MARHKNANWNLRDNLFTWEEANTAVLMDIRDELQQLNALLGCRNFICVPRVLDAIEQNTRKPKRKRRKESRA